MMRMNAGRAAKALRIAAHQIDRGTRARERAAGDHHARDAGRGGAPDHVCAIVVEAVVSEVDADVDELRRGDAANRLVNRDLGLCYRSAMNCSARRRLRALRAGCCSPRCMLLSGLR